MNIEEMEASAQARMEKAAALSEVYKKIDYLTIEKNILINKLFDLRKAFNNVTTSASGLKYFDLDKLKVDYKDEFNRYVDKEDELAKLKKDNGITTTSRYYAVVEFFGYGIYPSKSGDSYTIARPDSSVKVIV